MENTKSISPETTLACPGPGLAQCVTSYMSCHCDKNCPSNYVCVVYIFLELAGKIVFN